MKKMSKSQKALNYLLENKKITSKQAWDMFGVSRLSALIHIWRHKKGLHIEAYTIHPVDRWGNTCNCAEYHLIED